MADLPFHLSSDTRKYALVEWYSYQLFQTPPNGDYVHSRPRHPAPMATHVVTLAELISTFDATGSKKLNTASRLAVSIAQQDSLSALMTSIQTAHVDNTHASM